MREDAPIATLPASLSGRTHREPVAERTWWQRIARAMSFPGPRVAFRFVDKVCHSAFDELDTQGSMASVTEETDEATGVPAWS
jgi:choline/glycine/proline betaine transport protein